jgi:predicted transcriptional regulator
MTKKEKEESKELELDLPLEHIDPKERAIARARYKQFSKYCYWLLCREADGEELFYPTDLAKYAKITYAIAYRYFKDMVNFGYLKQISEGHLSHFELTKNDGHTKLRELLPYIKKTLMEK